ncbi:MAG: EAL domain-containing protein [Gemmatimonadota bacterium]
MSAPRAIAAILTMLVYVFSFAPLYDRLGSGTAALAVLPVSVVGWLLGTWGGLLAGMFVLPLYAFALHPGVGLAWGQLLNSGEAPWLGMLVLIGTGVGGIRDLTDRWSRALRAGEEAAAVNESLQSEIAERRRAEAALSESEERFRQVAENIEQVFWLVDCAERRVLYVSPAFESVWGRTCASLYERFDSLVDTLQEEGRAETASLFLSASGATREYRIERPDGTVRLIQTRCFPVRNGTGDVYRIAAISEDVTDRTQAEADLLRIASHDPLTGLPNRSSFMTRLQRSVGRLTYQPQAQFTVLFVDVDRFKTINDSLGHLKGDELLVSVGQRLEECVRPEDMVARLGGDEFAILLHGTSEPADAARVASRIQARLSEHLVLGTQEVFVSASIGIVTSLGYDHPEEMLRDADIAMYRAKQSGRARYQVFDVAMHSAAVTRLHLETDLRRAVEREEFILHYQPVVCLETGTVCGFEALVRWPHPQRGLVPPGEFIPSLEETGLIRTLGGWVLQQACRQLQQWLVRHPERESLFVSVNLSGKQFADRNLVPRVREVLRETGLSGKRLKLEVTETVLVDDPEAAAAMLAELKELGIQIQIDDFGTGYSSLKYLDQLPIDMLKVDRSFVSRIRHGSQGAEIVRTIVGLGKNLGIAVVAEGMETPAQLNYLKQLGCDYGQGYIFSRATSAEAAEDMLSHGIAWWPGGAARSLAAVG